MPCIHRLPLLASFVAAGFAMCRFSAAWQRVASATCFYSPSFTNSGSQYSDFPISQQTRQAADQLLALSNVSHINFNSFGFLKFVSYAYLNPSVPTYINQPDLAP